jgi:Carbamoyl-phosphate synthase L chain, ATP binding domain
MVSFAEAIGAAKPDLIVSVDDPAVRYLQDLYYREKGRGQAGAALCALVERSIGAAESFPVLYARTTFIGLAQEEGVRVPKSSVLADLGDLRNWAVTVGFPTVLKADGTSGGEGVRIVHTLEEAERAFRALQAPPRLALAGKKALADQDMTLIWPWLLRRRYVVNAQSFVAGHEATSLVACWNGTVLASLHFEVLNKQVSTGPASVLRRIENDEMSAATTKMVRRLNLSGLHGYDFMLEARTGNAYLIEINPRATQVGHLRLGPGRDLPAALYAAMTGKIVSEAPQVTEKDTIALFPQEWLRNPESPFIRAGYHDVPWEEPQLVRACISRRRSWSTRLSQRKEIQALSAARLPLR